MDDKTVIVVGFPKSGTTWTSRILGDVLNSPVRGFGESVPLAREGENRTGEYTIYQNHLALTKRDMGCLVPDMLTLSEPRWNGQHIIHIVRDPRDVTISAQHYWGIATLEEALECVYHGNHPVSMRYTNFIKSWLDTTLPVIQVRYEDLVKDTFGTISAILQQCEIDVDDQTIRLAVERQSFFVRKDELLGSKDTYPYSSGIQSKNLRKGLAGDWVNVFTPELKVKAEGYFGDLLDTLGYEHNLTRWDSALSILQSLFPMPDAGIAKCKKLFDMAREIGTGLAVELGTYHGRTAIAMGLGSPSLEIWCVDDYANTADWSGNVSSERDYQILQSNLERTGVKIALFKTGSLDAAKELKGEFNRYKIDLWFWDISTRDTLFQDWLAWRGYIKGRAFIRDLFDKSLGSREIIEYESTRDEFEVESEEPGILILRKRGYAETYSLGS